MICVLLYPEVAQIEMIFLSKLYIPAVAILVFGYPMTTVLITLSGLSVGSTNLQLKAIYVLLFLISLFTSVLRGLTHIPKTTAFLFLFFGIFAVRLTYDTLLRGVYAPLSSPTYVLGYVFALTIFPALCISISFERTDLASLNYWIHLVLLASCAMAFVQLIQTGSQFGMAIANQRLEIRGEGETAAVLNPITIGLCGATLTIFSLAHLTVKSGMGRLHLFKSTSGIILGLGALLLSGSRGPLLAFIIAVVFLIVAIFRLKMTKRINRQHISKRSYVLFGLIISGFLYSIQNSQSVFIALSRLIETFTVGRSDGVPEVREEIISDALNGILASPIFGSGHLALNGTAYAHNSILEALMSTGILGGMIFVGNILLLFSLVWRALMLRLDILSFPLAAVTIVLFTMSLFSMSISQSPEIWVSIFLFLTIAGRSPNAPRLPLETDSTGQ